MVSNTLNRLKLLYMQDQNTAMARMITEKQNKAVVLFEMGRYHEICGELYVLMAEGNHTQADALMQELIDCIQTIDAFRTSKLYSHMAFRKVDEQYYEQLRQMLEIQSVNLNNP